MSVLHCKIGKVRSLETLVSPATNVGISIDHSDLSSRLSQLSEQLATTAFAAGLNARRPQEGRKCAHCGDHNGLRKPCSVAFVTMAMALPALNPSRRVQRKAAKPKRLYVSLPSRLCRVASCTFYTIIIYSVLAYQVLPAKFTCTTISNAPVGCSCLVAGRHLSARDAMLKSNMRPSGRKLHTICVGSMSHVGQRCLTTMRQMTHACTTHSINVACNTCATAGLTSSTE